MSFYEKNKKHLSFYSDLFEKLDKISDTAIEYEFVQAKNQALTLKYKNVFLYSAYDPIREAKKNIDKIVLTDILILAGFGLGYTASMLQEKKEIKHLFILEFNLFYLKQLFTIKDFTDILKSQTIHLIYLQEQVPSILNFYDLLENQTINIVIEKTFPPEYKPILIQLQDVIQNKKTELLTYSRLGKVWFDNFLKNYQLKNSMQSCELFQDKLAEKPVLLVGAGPSLKSKIDYIKNERKNIFIIAIDTILKYLLKNEIVPDLVLSVDSQVLSKLHFYGIESSSLTFLFDTLANPDLVKKYISKSYFFKSGNPLNQFFPSMPQTSEGLSAANMAVDILYQLGVRTLYMIGVDFAYQKDTLYTGGNYFSLYWSSRINKFETLDVKYYAYYANRKLIPAQSKKGEPIQTTPILQTYAKALNSYVSQKQNLRLISLSDDILDNPHIEYKEQIDFNASNNFENKLSQKIPQEQVEKDKMDNIIYPVLFYRLYRERKKKKFDMEKLKKKYKDIYLQKLLSLLKE